MDLAQPLRVGRLRASVLHSDKKGLKQQLIRALLLTQAVGGGAVTVVIVGMQGEPAAAEANMSL